MLGEKKRTKMYILYKLKVEFGSGFIVKKNVSSALN